jgi:diadenosine tetraphosphate (Ap4A) HIT family hydrolase
MSNSQNIVLWESVSYQVFTLANPHIPYSEGIHLVVAPKKDIASAWEDPILAGKTFELASTVAAVAEKCELGPWFNIEAKGNWGLLPGRTPLFHIHIYGRNKTATWGKPLVLPELPDTFLNSPMPESDREILSSALEDKLTGHY